MKTLIANVRPFAFIGRAAIAALVLVGPTQASSSSADEAHWRGRGAPVAAAPTEAGETIARVPHNRGRSEADNSGIQETATAAAPPHNRGRNARIDREETVASIE